MKIIEAMKKVKDLGVKAQDLRDKVKKFCSDLTIETPTYADQRAQITEWIQAHHDILKEILRLRVCIQRTNIETQVDIEIGGKKVTKPLAAWIHRRRDLANFEMNMWAQLSDRGLKEQNLQTTAGGAVTEVRIRRYFDASVRDANHELYRSEPMIIDSSLEVINAVTDLIE